jgi:hypothetical protein
VPRFRYIEADTSSEICTCLLKVQIQVISVVFPVVARMMARCQDDGK